MVRRKVIIAVDKKFFDHIFEKDRKLIQNRLGLKNLSQANFTKMIDGFKLKSFCKIDINKRIKTKRKNNEFTMF